MYRSSWAALACAAAIAIAAAPTANRAAAQPKSETPPLPPVVVEQGVEPKTKASTAAKPKMTTAPSSASETAPEGPPTGDQAAAGEATPAIGVGTKGLALPLNTARLTGAAIKSQLPSTSGRPSTVSTTTG